MFYLWHHIAFVQAEVQDLCLLLLLHHLIPIIAANIVNMSEIQSHVNNEQYEDATANHPHLMILSSLRLCRVLSLL